MNDLSLAKMSSNSLKQMRNYEVSYLLFMIFSITLNTKAALFDDCDHEYTIKPGKSILQSPDYPNFTPAGTSCRYKYIAPLDYDITVNCTLNFAKGTNPRGTEYFYVDRDGDLQFRDSEEFYGSGTIIRKSLFRTIVLAYVSVDSFGSFKCDLTVQQQPCDCGWSVNTKIANGRETAVNEFPSMAALKEITSEFTSYCGAVIIAHKYLLSAGHCAVSQPNVADIRVLVGHHDILQNPSTEYAAEYEVSNIILHPQYSHDPINNDIAIFVTKTPIEWSRGVGPICLPPLANANTDFSNSLVDVVGWGSTLFGLPPTNILQKINVIITDHQTCANAYNDYITIHDTNICTYDSTGSGKDTCIFDSGGPVILKSTRQFLLGIISSGKPCGQGGNATSFNTRVTSYLQWIYTNTGYTTCNKLIYTSI